MPLSFSSRCNFVFAFFFADIITYYSTNRWDVTIGLHATISTNCRSTQAYWTLGMLCIYSSMTSLNIRPTERNEWNNNRNRNSNSNCSSNVTSTNNWSSNSSNSSCCGPYARFSNQRNMVGCRIFDRFHKHSCSAILFIYSIFFQFNRLFIHLDWNLFIFPLRDKRSCVVVVIFFIHFVVFLSLCLFSLILLPSLLQFGFNWCYLLNAYGLLCFSKNSVFKQFHLPSLTRFPIECFLIVRTYAKI